MFDEYGNDPSLEPGIQGNLIAAKVAQHGIGSMLSKTYTGNDTVTEAFYSGIGYEIGNDIPIVFGRILIKGQVTNQSILRSDLDPSKVKKVYNFVTSEGPTKGIVGVGEGKLQNVLINKKPAVNPATGSSDSNVSLKEIAGPLALNAGIMAGTSFLRDFLKKDPKTGKEVPDQPKNAIKGKLNTDPTSEVTGSGSKNQVWAVDPATGKFSARSFVDVHKESGIEVDDFVVMKDGDIVSANVMKLNFIGSGVTVIDAGNQQINIIHDGSGGGGGTPTPPAPTPTPTPPSPTPSPPAVTCSAAVAVTCDPRKGSWYKLMRNGVLFSSLQIDATNFRTIASKQSAAATLISHTIIPGHNASNKFSMTANAGVITITGNTDCKTCDQAEIGTWTLDCYSPPPVIVITPTPPPSVTEPHATDPCGPRFPKLS